MYTVQVLNLDLSCADFHHQLQYVHNKLHKKHYHGHYDFHPQYHHGYNVFHHQCHHGHDRNVNNAINQGRDSWPSIGQMENVKEQKSHNQELCLSIYICIYVWFLLYLIIALPCQSVPVVRPNWCDPGVWRFMPSLLALFYRLLPNYTSCWSLVQILSDPCLITALPFKSVS